MSTAPPKLLTLEEYLRIERAAPFRSEFFRGEMFAMSGASWEHSLVKDNLAREVGVQIKGGDCRVVTSDQRVKISETGLYTYPDLVVVCGEPQFEDDKFDTLLNPSVIVEVLSESTEKYDRGSKFGHYRRLPSVGEYILIAQNQPLIERYLRQPDDSWLLKIYGDVEESFEFGTLPVRVALREIYAGVRFGSESGPSGTGSTTANPSS